MDNLRAGIVIAFTLSAAILSAGQAAGQTGPKTFASIFGNDGNDCLTGPTACRTADRAIEQCDPFGTVVFDSAGDFGTAVINKPLILQFPHNGQMDVPIAGNPSANIIFNPANANSTLTIRGLYMDLLQRPADGIDVKRGILDIADSVITNGAGNGNCGILVEPNANGRVFITNTTISNMPNGLCINGRNGADVIGVIDNTEFFSSGLAIRSTAGNNTAHNILIRDSTISGNKVGVSSSGPGSNLRIQDTSVFGNTTGLSHVKGGQLTTIGGNTITGNNANGTFTGSVKRQ